VVLLALQTPKDRVVRDRQRSRLPADRSPGTQSIGGIVSLIAERGLD